MSEKTDNKKQPTLSEIFEAVQSITRSAMSTLLAAVESMQKELVSLHTDVTSLKSGQNEILRRQRSFSNVSRSEGATIAFSGTPDYEFHEKAPGDGFSETRRDWIRRHSYDTD